MSHGGLPETSLSRRLDGLVRRVGEDMQTLRTELDKAILYCMDRDAIAASDLEKLVGKQKGEIVKFLCGYGPNSLQGQVAIDNQIELFDKPVSDYSELKFYVSRGQVEINSGGGTRLSPVGELDDGRPYFSKESSRLPSM